MSSETATGRFTVDGFAPERVLRPGSVEELQEVLRGASDHGSTVIPWGGGTQMGFGNLATPEAIAVDLSGLDRVVDYEADDLTIGIQAGATLAATNELLGRHGQFLPAEAEDPAHATLGGLFASGIAGPRRLGFGSLRDLVLGISLVLPDGRLVHGGGKVVKNVSGFDLMRLNYGALGAFGVITQLNLKVLPLARAQRTVVARYQELAPALEASTRVRASALGPTAIVLANELAAQRAGIGEAAWTLALRCEAPPAAVTRQAERVHEAVEDDAVDLTILEDEETRELWWALSSGLSARQATDSANVRLGVVPSQALVALEGCAHVAADLGVPCALTADLGTGLIYARVEGPADALLAVWNGVAQSGSHRSLLGAPAGLKEAVDVFGSGQQGFQIMEALKEQFDPQRILNRGRFIGKL